MAFRRLLIPISGRDGIGGNSSAMTVIVGQVFHGRDGFPLGCPGAKFQTVVDVLFHPLAGNIEISCIAKGDEDAGVRRFAVPVKGGLAVSRATYPRPIAIPQKLLGRWDAALGGFFVPGAGCLLVDRASPTPFFHKPQFKLSQRIGRGTAKISLVSLGVVPVGKGLIGFPQFPF